MTYKGDFEQEFTAAQRAAEDAAVLAFSTWVVALILAVFAEIWVFRDASTRGKSALAAAVMVPASAVLNVRLTELVLCVWALLRPETCRRTATGSRKELPHKLPPRIVVGPSVTEFLVDLLLMSKSQSPVTDRED